MPHLHESGVAMSGHTAEPLVVGAHFAERHGGRTYIPILRPGNDPVPIAVVHRDVDGYGRDEGEATAAFIVTAYNSHADLVRALENVEGGYFDGASALVVSGDWKAFTEHLQALARAALATLRKVG